MTISTFMIFVATACSFTAPSSIAPSLKKEACMEYYVNCAIKDDGSVKKETAIKCNENAKSKGF